MNSTSMQWEIAWGKFFCNQKKKEKKKRMKIMTQIPCSAAASILPQENRVRVQKFDIMYFSCSQFQRSGKLLLPVQHVICYSVQVSVHSLMVPVQPSLQEGVGTGREGGYVRWIVNNWRKWTDNYSTRWDLPLNPWTNEHGMH